MTGYWFLDDEPDWKPTPDLEEFLRRGVPPIYVGFGSIGDPTQAEQTTELVISAIRQAGARAVLATGWAGMAHHMHQAEDIFFVKSVPHAWLFPRLAAVVHHGGAGTTAAGFRSGVPSVIIPFTNDQFAWGARAFELGVSPAPIPRKKLTAEKLAQAIRLVMGEEMRKKARALGEKIRAENGAAEAAQVILNAVC
jgi:sterol 3beta-glucosyltransferase